MGRGKSERREKVQEWIQPRARVAHRWLQATVYGPVSSYEPISPLASKKTYSWVPFSLLFSFFLSVHSFIILRPALARDHRIDIRTGDNSNFHAYFIVWNCIMSRGFVKTFKMVERVVSSATIRYGDYLRRHVLWNEEGGQEEEVKEMLMIMMMMIKKSVIVLWIIMLF